jgi:hypothetical protein
MRTRSILVLLLLAACGGTTHDASPVPNGGPDGGNVGVGPSNLPCNVDAILANNCRKCHSFPPQFGAPMSLMTHEALSKPAPSDASLKVYEMALRRIADDADPMPPSPNPRLSEADRATLRAWVDAGAPSSTETCATGPDTKPGPSDACTPDLPLRPGAKWTMPKDTKDEYVCYGFDIEKTTPTHIVGFEPRIDNTKIVHHLLLFEAPSSVDPTPTPCNAGGGSAWRIITGWAPGGKGMELPAEAGFPLTTSGKTHYVMQIHYSNLTGLEGETDGSGYDLCTSAPRPQEADVIAFGTLKFEIPPTNQPFTRDCTVNIPSQLAGKKFIAALPHMHRLGTAMATTLERSGQAPVDPGTVNNWSFNNQTWYPIGDQSLETKSGDVIRTKCTWKNDTGAPVGFGEETEKEMCYSFTMYYPRVDSPIWSWQLPAYGSTCK